MTAKEMFEELGFKEYKTHTGYKAYKNKTIYLIFRYNKNYHYYEKNGGIRHTLSIIPDDLKKAITQQMKELGWLDE